MKILLVITLTIVVTKALSVTDQWESFKVNHAKNYQSRIEENLRFAIFQSNLKKIQVQNAKYDKGDSSYYMKVNKFADMTEEEFKNLYLMQYKGETEFSGKSVSFSDAVSAKSVDWREKGAVLDVKDQGSCGSCWAFSSTGALEAQNYIVNGVSTPLSEQELVDCSHLYDNFGCVGGSMRYAFEYVRAHGISSEISYPYIAKDDTTCHRNATNIIMKIKDYARVEGNVEAMKKAIGSVGPVSIGIVADEALQLYGGGIFDESTCSNYKPNHAVLAVGYGSEEGKDYWIIKNSWGKTWGENGFFRIQMQPVICAVLTDISYPIV